MSNLPTALGCGNPALLHLSVPLLLGPACVASLDLLMAMADRCRQAKPSVQARFKALLISGLLKIPSAKSNHMIVEGHGRSSCLCPETTHNCTHGRGRGYGEGGEVVRLCNLLKQVKT